VSTGEEWLDRLTLRAQGRTEGDWIPIVEKDGEGDRGEVMRTVNFTRMPPQGSWSFAKWFRQETGMERLVRLVDHHARLLVAEAIVEDEHDVWSIDVVTVAMRVDRVVRSMLLVVGVVREGELRLHARGLHRRERTRAFLSRLAGDVLRALMLPDGVVLRVDHHTEPRCVLHEDCEASDRLARACFAEAHP
jgi:hypothetical protein